MNVTKANIQDLEGILQLNKLFHLDFSWFKWDTAQWIREEINNNHYYVIRNNGEVAAAMCLNNLGVESYIEAIAVQQAKQGKGYGKELIEFAKSFSKEQGKSQLTVGSFCEYNLEEFYKKCGFVKSSEKGSYKGRQYYQFLMNI